MKCRSFSSDLKGVLLGLLFCFSQAVEAITTKDVFAKYPNKYFIESGSYRGDGIKMALEGSFEEIYSIELSPHLYEICYTMFAETPKVHVLFGDTAQVMPELLKQIDAPATFWLDGHYSWSQTARGDTNTPILQELESIRNHPIKTHTILIDDVRQFGTVEFDFVELDDIIQKILEINPNYKIHYEDGYVPNDILVAVIKNQE